MFGKRFLQRLGGIFDRACRSPSRGLRQQHQFNAQSRVAMMSFSRAHTQFTRVSKS